MKQPKSKAREYRDEQEAAATQIVLAAIESLPKTRRLRVILAALTSEFDNVIATEEASIDNTMIASPAPKPRRNVS